MEIKQLCFQVFALQCLPHYDYKAKMSSISCAALLPLPALLLKYSTASTETGCGYPETNIRMYLSRTRSDQIKITHYVSNGSEYIYIYIQKFTVTAKTCSRGFFLLLHATIDIYHHLTLQQWGFPCCNFSQRHIICLGDW